MIQKIRALTVVGVIVAAVAIMANGAFAQGNKPGNGFGDQHHRHTGPPGQSEHPGDDKHGDKGDKDHGNKGDKDKGGKDHGKDK